MDFIHWMQNPPTRKRNTWGIQKRQVSLIFFYIQVVTVWINVMFWVMIKWACICRLWSLRQKYFLLFLCQWVSFNAFSTVKITASFKKYVSEVPQSLKGCKKKKNLYLWWLKCDRLFRWKWKWNLDPWELLCSLKIRWTWDLRWKHSEFVLLLPCIVLQTF